MLPDFVFIFSFIRIFAGVFTRKMEDCLGVRAHMILTIRQIHSNVSSKEMFLKHSFSDFYIFIFVSISLCDFFYYFENENVILLYSWYIF